MPDWLMQLLAMGAGGAGLYTAIRSDLARLHVKSDMAVAAAAKAHERIDDLLINGRGNHGKA